MDSVHRMINQYNPNKDNTHPYMIQKRVSHLQNYDNKNEKPNTVFVPLKDWKPGDIEMFAGMGFSAEKHGETGYHMEEDSIPCGEFEPQKFLRRVAFTKKGRWVLQKKENTDLDSNFKIEKIFTNLMGDKKNPGLLDFFYTLTIELTEQQYLYRNMKLKSIVEALAQEQVSQYPQAESAIQKGLTKEQKRLLRELVLEYNKYNEVLEARKKLMEVANKMTNIGELSESYLTEKIHENNTDENAWFEEKTVKRQTSEIKKLTAEFKKSASECDEKMRTMEHLYKECGMLLERFFEMQ